VLQLLGKWGFYFSTLAWGILGWPASSFGQTTGQISGIVKDETGAVIVGAEVRATHIGTLETHIQSTDSSGMYVAPLLRPGLYEVVISAPRFSQARYTDVFVTITNTRLPDVTLKLSSLSDEVTVEALTPLVEKDGPQLGSVVDSRTLQRLPVATRDFTHLLALSPGASAPLVDHKEVGRNSQDVTVNGARVTQNGFQINGVNANNWNTNTALRIARPALESVEELKIQTSLYDASQAGGGGGSIQLVTQSGGNELHGLAYGYLQNDAFNANDPFLKAASARRPVLRRNVYGGTVGGPIRKGGTYFFTSYQGISELNGLTSESLSSDVLIAPCVAGTCLSDDRSAATLLALYKPTFLNGQPANSIHPVALSLLNTKLPNGNFLIPTPQSNGRYSGSTPSSYAEDQINANLDSRLGQSNWFSTRIFLASAGSDEVLRAGPNVPGFGIHLPYDNCLATIQLKSTLSARAVNDLRLGYNFIRSDLSAKESILDSDVGIRRPSAGTKPGLGLIRIAPDANGIAFGTATRDFQDISTSATVADLVMVNRGAHGIRLGAEGGYLRNITRFQHYGRGQIDFSNFNDFLLGAPRLSVFGVGIGELDTRSTSYALFIQDDWKVVSKLTINLGLRYELSLPPYDTRGRISTFDSALYKPRLEADNAGTPVGPPAGGFVQAGNVISQYDLPEVPNVAPRVLESLDPNNLAPRIGFAYSPTRSDRLVVRAGYGMFYSQNSNTYLANAFQLPPYYFIARNPSPIFEDPFAGLPAPQEFPILPKGALLGNVVFDRGIRSPYVHQYNFSIQYSVGAHRLVEAAYVGSRGLNLRRVLALNQARLASPQQPIVNEVTGQVITSNTPANAQLRAPFQGIATMSFGLNQTTGQSTYHSLQMSVRQRFSQGVQFLASYTLSKSIDNTASGTVSGGNVANEGAFSRGNVLDDRANRGLSDFDSTHRIVSTYLWDLPHPAFAAQPGLGKLLLSNWQVAGIVVAMSGRPIDIVDIGSGSLYGLSGGVGGALSRPNFIPGINPRSNVPAGYYFNPFAFVRPFVRPGQAIPSSNGLAVAGSLGTDIGTVGRNTIRGPAQINVDFSISKHFPLSETKRLEFRAEFLNLFNHVNLANPISNLNAVTASGTVDQTSGRIIGNAGDFGRITSTTNNPRLVQFGLKLTF